MSANSPRRLAWLLALALLIRIGWVTVVHLKLFASAGYEPWHIGPFAEISERFASLQGMLPPGHVIGFATSQKPGDADFDWRQRIARYTLAPVILDATDRHQSVIADFPGSTALATYVKTSGGVLRAQPEMGLGLVEKPDASR